MGTKIFIAGHQGLVGSAFLREVQKGGEFSPLIAERKTLNLLERDKVFHFFENEKPQWVVIAAAKVGGIHANIHYPVEFLLENLKIQMNLMEAAYHSGVEKLLFLGSNCMYPKNSSQPLKESSLLTGNLEPTNEAYAMAKLAGWKACEAYNREYNTQFYTLIPTGMIGLNDNYHSEHAHVIPTLIRRFHEHKLRGESQVSIWGSGKPLREFLWSEDFAEFALKLMKTNSPLDLQGPLNVGAGKELSIREIAETLKSVIYPEAQLEFDSAKPDGMLRKCLDSSKALSLGHSPKVSFSEGIRRMYEDFLHNPSLRK